MQSLFMPRAKTWTGAFTQGLSPLFEICEEPDLRRGGVLAGQWGARAASYGKAALVGFDGDLDHWGRWSMRPCRAGKLRFSRLSESARRAVR
ncbi:hypothetical protein E2L05_01785 [Meridianimarinicoccus aquatilis]|uniref:Uncharacterized protein n=1 Tax=Meridianimarinicoccus aquatilis TaxID=2552766 RepID=A0A4V3BCI8_9RHOB|nr:hypothetical protein E2L05_01785 [Fluviibacterium aquatile]